MMLLYIYNIKCIGLVLWLWPFKSNCNSYSTKERPICVFTYCEKGKTIFVIVDSLFAVLYIFWTVLRIFELRHIFNCKVEPCHEPRSMVQVLFNRAIFSIARFTLQTDWTVPALYLNCTWTVHGLYLNCTWTIHKPNINYTRFLYSSCTVHFGAYVIFLKRVLLFWKRYRTHQCLEIAFATFLNFYRCLYSINSVHTSCTVLYRTTIRYSILFGVTTTL